MHEQGFKTSSTGLVHGMPPEPCVVVILGVAGDLARTTLVPSLYALGCEKLLPEPFALLGMARRAWDHDTFRATIRTYAQEKKGFSDETWRQFAKRLHFVRGDLDAPPTEDYARLRACLKAVQAEHHIPDNVLFHQQLPLYPKDPMRPMSAGSRGAHCVPQESRLTPPAHRESKQGMIL